MRLVDSFFYISVCIFMPATFIIGFLVDIVKFKFVGLYMTISECKKFGDFNSYITLYSFYVINTWIFIIFLPARVSQLLIRLTKIKGIK